MTVTNVKRMSVDDSSSDSSCPKDSAMIETPPQIRRKKKKRPHKPLIGATFVDLYKLTGETLGEGSYGSVENYKNVFTGIEYAIKIIEKRPGSKDHTPEFVERKKLSVIDGTVFSY